MNFIDCCVCVQTWPKIILTLPYVNINIDINTFANRRRYGRVWHECIKSKNHCAMFALSRVMSGGAVFTLNAIYVHAMKMLNNNRYQP